MSSQTPVTAVFDIGKTNKKFLLFDENYSIVHSRYVTLEEKEDDDGFAGEDLDTLVEWLRDVFEDASESREFRIEALNFSTYGASLVHLDENGKPATPLYNYLKPFPEELLEEFYEKYGGRKEFSLGTASPPMGMLNSGLQLYWLKRMKPDVYRKISHSLHFPQYLHFLFTGELSAEKTSIGCHTAMWNYEKNNYHRWLKEEGVLGLLPEVQPVSLTRDVTYKNRRFRVGLGIHDSSAALVPYLYAFDKPFLQVSTGTWSIAMNPFTQEPLTFDELQRDCLLYMNIHGKPVKASRLFLGSEYSHQKKKLKNYFHNGKKMPDVEPDSSLLIKLSMENRSEKKLQLETAHTSGPYPQKVPGEWSVEQFTDCNEAYHQLMLDLVSIQADSIKLAQGSEEIKPVIITGGFSQNDFFTRLLATFLPEKNIYTAVTSHASALGAALVTDKNKRETTFMKELLGLKHYSPFKNVNIAGYSWKE